jgi:hypothetical protein
MINGYAHINFLQINIVLYSVFKRAHCDLSGCPVNPVVVGEKVLRRYKTALEDVNFFAEGRPASLKRVLPFVLPWLTFWLWIVE